MGTSFKKKRGRLSDQAYVSDHMMICVQGCALIVVLLGASAFIGWVMDTGFLASFGEHYYPMAPSTAIGFLAVGTALALTARRSGNSDRLASGLALVALLIVVLRMVESVTGSSTGLFEWLFNVPKENFGPIPVGKMAIFTALCFLFAIVALISLILVKDNKPGRYFAGALSGVVIFVSSIFALGYLYGQPLFYGVATIPMALPTAIAFLSLGVGLLILIVGYESVERRSSAAAQAYLAAIVESSNDAIIGTTLDGIITSWNSAAERLYRYSSAEVIGRHVPFLAPADHQGEFPGLVEKVKRGEHVEHFETVRVGKEGQRVDVSLTVSPIRDSLGEIIGIARISRDITERKRAEEELRRNKELIQAIIDNTSSLVFLKDLAGRYFLVNKEFEKALNLDRASIIGKTAFDLVPPDAAERLREDDLKVLKAGKAMQMVETSPLWDGIHTFLSAKFVLSDANNVPYATGGVATDITGINKAQDEIAALNASLRKQAAASYAANKELESFSYSVSHDLRAPLRSIDGFTQILLEDYAPELPEAGQGYLQRVRSSAQKMACLIDDLLNLSRVTRKEMRPESIDLTRLARKIMDNLRESEPERQVTLSIEDGLRVSGDPHLLQVMLENLLQNAWKYTSKHPQAHIEFGRMQQNGETVYFVRDDGAGFDMTYSGKLFGAFQRLHRPDEFEGTGIGLATVQRIINRHDGRVWAEGSVEQGATFYFTL